jgi:asparagine synthase (glutamine-hydrolysing)
VSGVVGVWSRTADEVDPGLARTMAETIRHRGPDGAAFHASAGSAVGLQRLAVTAEDRLEPAIPTTTEGGWIVLDGRVDDREELARRIPGCRLGELSDAVLVLALFRAHGTACFPWLVGDFAFALHDAASRRLLLVRDGVGTRPLYWTTLGGRVLFASEIKALLAVPGVEAVPDDRQLASLLLRDAELARDDGTFLLGVRRVPPAHFVELTANGERRVKYWDFVVRAPLRRSYPEAVEEMRSHFGRAVRRRLRAVDPVAVSVSGGVDSSAIFCLGERLHADDPARWPRPFGVSYESPPGSPGDEREFVEAIRDHYGSEIHWIPLVPGLGDAHRGTVWHSEVPFVDELGATNWAVHEAARARGARVMLNGLWGDQVLFDPSYLAGLAWRMRWPTVLRHLREFPLWYTDVAPRVYRRRFLVDFVKAALPGPVETRVRRARRARARRERAMQWYTGRLHRHRGTGRATSFAPAFRKVDARNLYTLLRNPVYQMLFEVCTKIPAGAGLDVGMPFLDRDLLEFLMTIPGEVRNHGGVPKGLLRTAMGGVLPPSIMRRRTKADFTDVARRSLALYAADGASGLGDGPAVGAGYLVRETVAEELRQLTRLPAEETQFMFSLSELMGLDLWLQLFCPPADALPRR